MSGLCRTLSSVVLLTTLVRKQQQAHKQGFPFDRLSLGTLKQLPVCVTCPPFDEGVSWHFTRHSDPTLEAFVSGQAADDGKLKGPKDLPQAKDLLDALAAGHAVNVSPPPYALAGIANVKDLPFGEKVGADDMYSPEGMVASPRLNEVARATLAFSDHGLVFRLSEFLGSSSSALAQQMEASMQMQGDIDKAVAPYLQAAYRLVRAFGIEFKEYLTAKRPSEIKMPLNAPKPNAQNIAAKSRIWATAFEDALLAKIRDDGDGEDWAVLFEYGTDLAAPVMVDCMRQIMQSSGVAAMVSTSGHHTPLLERNGCALKYAQELATEWSDYDLVGLLLLLKRVWRDPRWKEKIEHRWSDWAARVLFARVYCDNEHHCSLLWAAKVLQQDAVEAVGGRRYLHLPEDVIAEYDWTGADRPAKIDVSSHMRTYAERAEVLKARFKDACDAANIGAHVAALQRRVDTFMSMANGGDTVTVADRLTAWKVLWQGAGPDIQDLALKLPVMPSMGVIPITRLVLMPPPKAGRMPMSVVPAVYTKALRELTRPPPETKAPTPEGEAKREAPE